MLGDNAEKFLIGIQQDLKTNIHLQTQIVEKIQQFVQENGSNSTSDLKPEGKKKEKKEKKEKTEQQRTTHVSNILSNISNVESAK